MATTTVLRQRQLSVQESLSPQKLREWAIWWGSPGGGASRARAGGAGAGGPRTRRQEPLSSQQLRKRAVRWAAPVAEPGVLIMEVPVSLLLLVVPLVVAEVLGVDSNGSSVSPEQLRKWAVQWGSPGGGALGTSAGGASCCFFRDSTTVTLLTIPVPVTLADPSGGPVVARGATVLPCPVAPLGLLTGLHLPSFAKHLVATSVLQDQWVTVTQRGGKLVAICTDSRTGEHLATFTRRPGYGLYTLTTESALVAESRQVAASVEVGASCPCRLLTHQTLLWHHRLGHPSLPRLRGMHSCLLISGLPRSQPPLLMSLAPPCLPCVEGRHRVAPHSSFPLTTSPLQTLHMDVWVPARVPGQGGERYFLLVIDDYTCYTMVFPLQSKAEVRSVLIRWIQAVRRQLSARFQHDLPVLRLHSDRGGEFSSGLLEDFCGAEGAQAGVGPDAYHPADIYLDGDTPSAHQGTGAGGPGTSRQEALSPEQLREWAVQWGSPGGGASRARTTRAGGAGTPGAAGDTRGAAVVGAAAGSPGSRRQASLSPERLREWAVRWGSPVGGARRAGAASSGGTGPGGASAGVPVTSDIGTAGGTGGAGAAACSRGASPRGASADVPRTGDTCAAGGTGGAGAAGGTGPGGASTGVPEVGRAGGTGTGGGADTGGTTGVPVVELVVLALGGAVATRAGGSGGVTTQPQPSALCHLLSLTFAATEFPVAGTTPLASVCARVRRPCAPAVPSTHDMTLRPSSVPQCVVLPSPPASSLAHVPDPKSDLVRAASPTVTRLFATVVIDPSFESAAASASVAELVDIAALWCLDYTASLVFESSCPPSVRDELALGTLRWST
ncbi:unnamed protein product [Closterium sp. NIES-53]